MRITIKTQPYLATRYGQPWIAVITEWPVGGRPVLRWGVWLGRNGCEGQLEIEAEPGDIVRWGQKDHRGKGKASASTSAWLIVGADGALEPLRDIDARAHWLTKNKAS